jgi:hypothetical protein
MKTMKALMLSRFVYATAGNDSRIKLFVFIVVLLVGLHLSMWDTSAHVDFKYPSKTFVSSNYLILARAVC